MSEGTRIPRAISTRRMAGSSSAVRRSSGSGASGNGERPTSSSEHPVERASATAKRAVMPRAPPVSTTTDSWSRSGPSAAGTSSSSSTARTVTRSPRR
jgi:hypothetical protein